jgi:intracellular sulfur oxidation DsrE/DsrF family protein
MKQPFAGALPLLLVLLFTFSSTKTIAQASAPLTKQEKNDLKKHLHYAFLAEEDKHLKGAWQTYQQLTEAGIPVRDFEVVVIGKLAKNIAENPELHQLVTEKSDGKFRVTVCDMALEKLQVDKQKLPAKAEIISNGYLRIFQLQANNYLTVQP